MVFLRRQQEVRSNALWVLVLIEDDSWINSLVDAKPRAFWFAPT